MALNLNEEQIREIQKSIIKRTAKRKQECYDIDLIINALHQANALYLAGDSSKSEFIELIIQAKDLMIKRLTEGN